MGLLSALFGPSDNSRKIDWAIENLGKEGSVMGTAYREISYEDVVAYISKNKCEIITVREKSRGKWIEFKAAVNGKFYTVCLDKTFDGNGSVLLAQMSNKA